MVIINYKSDSYKTREGMVLWKSVEKVVQSVE